jgi:membrane protease YdiL (CAAX protease family)
MNAISQEGPIDQPDNGQPSDGQPSEDQPSDGPSRDDQLSDDQLSNDQPSDDRPRGGRPRGGQRGAIAAVGALLALVVAESWTVLSGPDGYWQMAVFKAAFLGVGPLALVMFMFGGAEAFIGSPRRKPTLICAAGGLGLAAIVYGGAVVTTLFVSYDATHQGLIDRGFTSIGAYIPALIYFVIANSLLEEFFFRGVLAGTATVAFGAKNSLLLSCAAFALYHVAIIGPWFGLGLSALAVVGLFAVGLALSWIRQWSGSIIGSWLVHAGADLGIGLFAATHLLS